MNAVRSDLLCIHGYTASWRNWDPVVSGLEPHHRVHVARLASATQTDPRCRLAYHRRLRHLLTNSNAISTRPA
jgi:pimeloyl-ACP methyl ester carboxylesterase